MNHPARSIRVCNLSVCLNAAVTRGQVSASHRVWSIMRITRETRSHGCCQERSGSPVMAGNYSWLPRRSSVAIPIVAIPIRHSERREGKRKGRSRDSLKTLPVLHQNLSRWQVVDLAALIRRESRLDDHPLAPPASTPPVPLRRPPPARPRKPCLAPPARRVQEDGAPAQASHDGSPLLGRPISCAIVTTSTAPSFGTE